MPLSVAEIRRLLWRLGVSVRQTIGAVIEWSWWRRWHQGVARYHHYQRRCQLTT
jgi:uncharacterized protein YjlB